MANKSISVRLLSGTSVLALALGLATGAAKAGHEEFIGVTVPPPGIVVDTDIDYLWIEDTTVEGDVVNDAVISPGQSADGAQYPAGGPEAVGITVTDDSVIEGSIINNNLIDIFAFTSDTLEVASAGGILVEDGSTVEGNIENNGLIQVLAEHTGSDDADAFAFGIAVTAGATFPAMLDGEIINNGQILVDAFAEADVAATAFAEASAVGIYHAVIATGAGDATSIVRNLTDGIDPDTGTIDVNAHALAISTTLWASADVSDVFGIEQDVSATGTGDAAALVENTGNILVSATADAQGATSASADVTDVYGIYQQVSAWAGNATAEVLNSGLIDVDVQALAVSTVGDADASAWDVFGIYQNAWSGGDGNALAHVDNSGTLNVNVLADADGATSADAEVSSVYGIYQEVSASDGDATAEVLNSGLIQVDAQALAVAGTAWASAEVDDVFGIYQDVWTAGGGNALAHVDNSGTLLVSALADAQGATSADAEVSSVYGIYQEVSAADGDATAEVLNSGLIEVDAQALAVATDGEADASVWGVHGVDQDVWAAGGGNALGHVNNSGTLMVSAIADADGASWADAEVSEVYGIYQEVSAADGDATAEVLNSGLIQVDAQALAVGGTAWADASVWDAHGVDQEVWAGGTGNALGHVDNSGTLLVNALADADGATWADAQIEDVYGIYQEVSASDGNATAEVLNSGLIQVDAQALAVAGTAWADAEVDEVHGVYQDVWAGGTGNALAHVSNSGTLLVSALAQATGATEADAEIDDIYGIYQEVSAADGDATAEVLNSGLIEVNALAGAFASTGNADADVDTVVGIYQDVSADGVGDALGHVSNSGTISVTAVATADGPEWASAEAGDVYGIYQDVWAGGTGNATAEVLNDGLIEVRVDASALSAEGEAWAGVDEVWGVYQDVYAWSGGDALAQVNNSDTIRVIGVADAQGSGTEVSAWATSIIGIDQSVGADLGNATASILNSGLVEVGASALAVNADGSATAWASAFGGLQFVDGNGEGTIIFDNSGSVLVDAQATAVGDPAFADAFARGERMLGAGSDILTAQFLNSGVLHAQAEASAVGGASATAFARAGGVLVQGATLGGDSFVENTGTVRADAIASATADDFALADARANGMRFQVDTWEDGVTISNVGEEAHIIAYAEAFADAATATATALARGILFEDRLSAHVPGGEVTLINNSGMIWAGESVDGGVTVTRGTAIDTRGMTALVQQQWMGETHWGRIFGDVNIKEGETITVSDGVTKFNGIVNADEALVGDFTIADGGTLFLAMWDPCGPLGGFGCAQVAPQVNVDTFVQEADASLWFEINAPPDATPVQAGPPDSFIGQINANDASIDGEVAIRVVQPQVFPDVSRYEDVVVAAAGEGQWATERSFTPLLDLNVDYSDWDETGGGGAIHFDVTRVAFDEADLSGVGGFTSNKLAVAGALENVFDDVLLGDTPEDFELLVGTLFTLDAAEFRRALNQLEGSQHAQGLWSVTGSLDMFKRAENARLKYDPMVQIVAFGAPEPVILKDPIRTEEPVILKDPIRQPVVAPGAFWLNAQGNWGDVDGDANAPGFDHQRYSVHVGADYMFTPGLTLGAAVGWMGADLDFDDSSDKIEYDGVQIGGYGKYEWLNWYVNVLGAYGNYNGDSRRGVAITRDPEDEECGCLPTGFVSSNKGDFDAEAWMVSGEFGHRFAFSELGWIAPFAGVTYQRGEIDGFNEKGSASALRVDGDGESVVSDVGVRVGHSFVVGAGTTAGLELRASWLHEFGDDQHKIDVSFVGVPGSEFKVKGSDFSRDTAAVDAGLTFEVHPGFVVGASYNGRFSSDLTEHGVMGKAIYRF